MTINPLVSIVIPCYNHENFVQDTIQSIIDQTYENIELIVIDDGSQDNSVTKIQQMIEHCKQRFVRFEFRDRPNKGLSATLNEAVEWCKGEYFSAIASDDIMIDKKTAIQVNLLNENQHITAVFGGAIVIDKNNNKIDTLLYENREYNFENIILHQHILPAPTQMIRMKVLEKIGGYKSELIIEDWYMWLKLSQFGNILYVKEIFSLYRQHDSNISNNVMKMRQGRLDVLDYFKDSEHYREAINNVRWINANEKYSGNKKYQFGYFKETFTLKPFKVSNMFFKYAVRIIKNKIRSFYK